MATAKKIEEEKVAESVMVSAPPTEEAMVKIKLPRMGKDDTDVYVSVNDRTWLIKRGIEVEVPVCVAEVLEHQETALEQAYLYEEEIKKG